MHTMLFYKNPAVLNTETHRNLRIQRMRQPSFGFAAETNSVFLAGIELPLAAMHYPIVFSHLPNGKFVLMALLGLRDRENLFVSPDGRWKEGAYIPAFVRRYPFVTADAGDATLQVCIDEGYAGFGKESGAPLFDADGKPSETLEQAMALLLDYHRECKRTDAFTQKLQGLGLFKEVALRTAMHADGAEYALNGVHIVDEQKLLALHEDDVFDLFRQGYMAWLYAHLISQANLGNLVEELARRRAALSSVPDEMYDPIGTHPELLGHQLH